MLKDDLLRTLPHRYTEWAAERHDPPQPCNQQISNGNKQNRQTHNKPQETAIQRDKSFLLRLPVEAVLQDIIHNFKKVTRHLHESLHKPYIPTKRHFGLLKFTVMEKVIENERNSKDR